MAKKKAAVLESLVFDREDIVTLLKVQFGLKSAGKETNEFLTEKIAGLADELDDDDLTDLEEKDEASFQVATAILEAIKEGQPVVVANATASAGDDDEESPADDDDEPADDDDDEPAGEDEEEEEKPVPKKGKKPVAKPAAKVPAKKGVKPPAKPAKEAKPVPAKKGAKPVLKMPEVKKKRAVKDGGTGAIRAKTATWYIVKYLAQASEAKPVKKTAIVEALVKKFPLRDPSAIAVTTNSQINGQLKANKGMEIGSKKMKDGTTGYWVIDMGGAVLGD